ncbi:hypothetical protein [Rhodococcus sp. SORGH_AS_0303]|uniref:hypothetical protein n=1 Tax=Rhodococcus sp. SORGH_AS_0303 TaxID=3041753 RepID=UPI00277F763F|nr:hypothetical protein [Rhodococcus sp. SORGH_AS_0303]MDQ1202852.1 outer membrane murein-binding lipoprotein Lpp [Rhodococcus sp. SORGH_AS_0303]
MIDHLTTITIICAAIGAVATGVGTVMTYRGRVQTGNVNTLTERVTKLESQVTALDEWKIAARYYIAQLRGTLADRGIQSPTPPVELQLHLRVGDHDGE